MEQPKKASLINSIIGTPEVQVSLKKDTIFLFFGALIASVVIIFLAHELIKKK